MPKEKKIAGDHRAEQTRSSVEGYADDVGFSIP